MWYVHDFMALRSALGEVTKPNQLGRARQYQALIRRSFSQGKFCVD
jgi:hypothetical protein